MHKKIGILLVIGLLVAATGLAAKPDNATLAKDYKTATVEGWIGKTPSDVKGSGYIGYADFNNPVYFVWGGVERGTYFYLNDFSGQPPVIIDTILMLFYEDSAYPWPDSTVHIVIYGSDSITPIYTSPNFIAHRYPDPTYYVPPTPITVNDREFYIMVVPEDTSGFPSILSDDVPQGHSFYRMEPGGSLSECSLGEYFIAAHGTWTDLNHDVGIADLLSPPSVAINGFVYSPEINVVNYGLANEVFDATLKIYDSLGTEVYSASVSGVAIDSGSSTVVTFDPWAVNSTGHYDLVTYVSMGGDEDLSNDTLYSTVEVVDVNVISTFETDSGGFVPAPEGGWQWGVASVGPPNAHSGTNLWGTLLNDNYPNNANFYLTSPDLIAQGDQQVIGFWHWGDIENHYDGGNVEISTDGGTTWELIYPVGGYTYNNVYALGGPGFTGDFDWSLAVFPLNLPDGTVFRIRLHFASDVSVNYAGWYVDDLSGYNVALPSFAHDVGVSTIDYPSPLLVNDTFSVNVGVFNNGSSTETFDVTLDIYDENKSLVYSATSTVTDLAAGGNTTVAFDNCSLSETGLYQFVTYVSLIGDENPNNDTLVRSDFAFSIGYGFEADNGGFVADPDDGWQWGTPTSGPMGAHSGQNLWATVLDGNYANNADWYLYSPDFIATTDNPVLAFWQWYNIESGYDGGNVSISTDGGNTWTLIEPVGGYDDNSIVGLDDEPGFTGNSGGWVQTVFNLDGVTAGTVFKIRFRFGSDGSVTRDGWYIDDLAGIGFNEFVVEHDVQPVAVTVPADIWPTLPFDITVGVANVGLYPETFDVRLIVTDANNNVLFDQTQSVTDLAVGDTMELTYGGCVVPYYGAYHAVAITLLDGDDYRGNDTLDQPFSMGFWGNPHMKGPDAYGYYLIDNELPRGPQFNWIEPTDSTANVVTKGKSKPDKGGNSINSWDDDYFIVPLPFSFTFYGNAYDTAYVSTNGYIAFSGGRYTALGNIAIPNPSTPNDFIAPFWDDLKFYDNDSARLDTVSGVTQDGVHYFVIEYENVAHYGRQGEVMDFEVILYENGDILVQYGSLGDGVYNDGSSATVGIENADGTIGLQYLYNGDPLTLHDSLAVLFTLSPVFYHDVALDAVVVPENNGHYVAGETIQPVVRVKNTGVYPEADTFDVNIEIQHAKAVVASYSKTVYLFPGDSLDVTFDPYLIPEEGDYTVEAYVSMAGDEAPENDTLVTTFYAEGRDGYVSEIVEPADTVLFGTSVAPLVKVVNNGTTTDTFAVTMAIPGLGYQEEVDGVEIEAGDTAEVAFPSVIFDQEGELDMIAYTHIEYDLNTSNDTLERPVFVGYPDVGVDSIINPLPITYTEGDTFIPVVRVHNFGNVRVNTPVVVEIWHSYAKDRTLAYADTVMAEVPEGDYVDVTFNQIFTLVDSGYYEVDAFTLLDNDMDNSNDSSQLFFSSFIYRDIGIDNVVAPVDSYNIWETVIPEIVLRNYGTNEATFTAKLKIFHEGTLVVVDSVANITLQPSAQTNIQFAEYQFEATGNYTFKFCVKYGEDMDTTNNMVIRNVFVAAHDIALTGVVEPSGNLYETETWIYPAVNVVNNGNVAETFDVQLAVLENGVPYATLTTNVTLDAGASIVAAFDSVQLASEGDYEFIYTVNVPYDTCGANNQISTVVTSSYHDVAVAEILDLSSVIYHVGDNVELTAAFENLKPFDENINVVVDVRVNDSLAFTRTMPIFLAHNSVDTVEFTVFTVPTGGYYTVDFRACLPTDHDTTNNMMTRTFLVPEMQVADSVPMFEDTLGNWQFGQPTLPDEPSAFSGDNLWGTVLGGSYQPDADWTLYMSDWLDVTGDDPAVVFYQWYQFGAGDGGWIQVELGDGSIVDVTPVGGYNGEVNGHPAFVGTSDGWEGVAIELGNILTNGDSFKLLLHFHSDGVDEGLGWYVDDMQFVQVYQRLPNDVAVRELWAPTAAQPLYRGQLVNLWTILSLTSNTPASRTFRVIAKVFDNDGVLVYSASAVVRGLNPGDMDTVYFSPGWIPFEVGTYRFTVTVYNLGDPNIANNILATNIVVQADKGAHEDQTLPVPQVFTLANLAPNPFSDNLEITFGIPKASHVRVQVYDAQGRVVNELANGQFNAGYHTIRWNGKNMSGRSVGSGIYFVRMQSGDFSAVRRVVLVR